MQEVIVPVEGVDVEEECARGIGVVGDVCASAREPPDQERIDCAEEQLATCCARARAWDVVEQPLDFGAGEVGVDDESRLGVYDIAESALYEIIADRRGEAALPDDGIMDRLAGGTLP